MKKSLLYLFLLLCSSGIAQILQSENFNALTVGNVGTDITGVTVGQGGWSTYNATGSTNSDNSNYQVVSRATGNNAVQITGSNTATGTRYMWKNGLLDAWTTRTVGNNIIEVEFDFNPSVASTSSNGFRLYIFSAEATPKVLAGIGIAKNATVSGTAYQNVVQGFGHWTSTPGTGTYSFGLGPDAATPITLQANTWVRLGFSFNKTTGEIKWKGPNFNSSFTGSTTFPTVTSGIDPGEVDFLVTTATGNTLAAVGFYDDLIVRASATDTLLSTQSNTITDINFSIYPNPTSSILNISNPNNVEIKSISVVDINGRIVRNQSDSLTQINVSDLNAGVYFVTIEAAEGKTTKKFIKQ